MRHYLICGDRVTPCRKRSARLAKGNLLVASAQDLRNSALTIDKLLAIHRALPGARAMTKVRNRKAAVERLWAALQVLPASKRRPAAKFPAGKRSASKQARVIDMLHRPGGVTIEAIAKKMGWQRHTVRGLMAGALKKKVGLIINSEKGPDDVRV
jgi:hypothetical protein